jgi:hypothetical protein
MTFESTLMLGGALNRESNPSHSWLESRVQRSLWVLKGMVALECRWRQAPPLKIDIIVNGQVLRGCSLSAVEHGVPSGRKFYADGTFAFEIESLRGRGGRNIRERNEKQERGWYWQHVACTEFQKHKNATQHGHYFGLKCNNNRIKMQLNRQNRKEMH